MPVARDINGHHRTADCLKSCNPAPSPQRPKLCDPSVRWLESCELCHEATGRRHGVWGGLYSTNGVVKNDMFNDWYEMILENPHGIWGASRTIIYLLWVFCCYFEAGNLNLPGATESGDSFCTPWCQRWSWCRATSQKVPKRNVPKGKQQTDCWWFWRFWACVMHFWCYVPSFFGMVWICLNLFADG